MSLVHTPVRTPMYELSLSQSDQRIHSVFQSVYNNTTFPGVYVEIQKHLNDFQLPSHSFWKMVFNKDFQNNIATLTCITHNFWYTSLVKLLAWQARPGKTCDGSRNKAENYSSISATNQHQLSQKMYQRNLQSFFV